MAKAPDTAIRLGAAGTAAACLGVLAVAAWLRPSGLGHGTHTQLGLPPCTWAGLFGHPCPTCGMTTAFAHAADGHLAAGFLAQPFGLALSLGAATLLWGCIHAATSAPGLARWGGRLLGRRFLWGSAASALAAWAYKLATWSDA